MSAFGSSTPGELLRIAVIEGHRYRHQQPTRVRPRPHQQHCRSNIRLCCHKLKRQQCRTKFRPIDKVETN